MTNTTDSGPGSLRDAIDKANLTLGLDTIAFQIGTGAQTISPSSALPAITDPVVMDATSQPGFDGRPLIRLDGASAGAGVTGLVITAGSSTVRGLQITAWSFRGIELAGAGSNLIAGNYIGTDGGTALGNAAAGVIVDVGSTSNTIGGTVPGDRNLISGNARGVVVAGAGTSGNLIEGNYIGTNAAGSGALPNRLDGILIVNGSTSNTTGGTAPGAGNVISGNGAAGVDITTAGANAVLGNYIGTDATGTAALGNQKGVGLGDGSPDNLIGGATPAARNVISGNVDRGVVIGNSSNGNLIEGNYIGTTAAGNAALPNGLGGVLIFRSSTDNTIGGTVPGAGNAIAFNADASNPGDSLRGGVGVLVDGAATTGNTITTNSIHDNAALGISLGNDGLTANDEDDLDTGPNNLQNFPLIAAVSAGSTNVAGTLNSTPSTTFRLEFFSSPACDPSGNGEGETFLGAQDVTTDAEGDAAFSASFATEIGTGDVVTATATDPAGSTSEFSACRAPAPRTLTVRKRGTGSGTVSAPGINCGPDCTETYNDGTKVTMTATADAGSAFAGWTGCDAPAANRCTMTMNAGKTLTATFKATGVTLTVRKRGTGSGTVTSRPVGINCGAICSAQFADSTSVTLTAVASAGSFFSRWTGCDAPAANRCTMTMDAGKTLTATFKATGVRISSFSIAPTAFAPAPAGAAARAAKVPRGARFRYRLSGAATVRIAIERRLHGFRLDGRCRAPGRSVRRALRERFAATVAGEELTPAQLRRRFRAFLRRHRCTRSRPTGALSDQGETGLNVTPFSGRNNGRPLPPGRYQATASAMATSEPPAEPTVRFRIVKLRRAN